MSKINFDLGELLMTPGLLHVISRHNVPHEKVDEAMDRHHAGDWGLATKIVQAENEKRLAKRSGAVMSKHQLTDVVAIWIVTDLADITVTTVMLTQEISEIEAIRAKVEKVRSIVRMSTN